MCSPLRVYLPILLLLLLTTITRAAEVIPPSPAQYVNDYAHVMSPAVVEQLNDQLTQFERNTSNQIVVAIYPHMQSDSDIADYCVRIAQSWKVGQVRKKNGTVLFVFTDDHKVNIEVGYGLEGALPDATCKEIIDQQITPHFKTGDYDGGVTAAVNSIIAATKGEYKGTGHAGNAAGALSSTCGFWFILIVIILFVIFSRRSGSSGWVGPVAGMMLGGGGFGGGGGGGGFSSGGGGGFSGGGGSFGGGGASGSW